jgi:hypothetical protein
VNSFPEWAAKRLHAQKERGAQGLKIWKPLGLHVKDHQGKLVDVDDAKDSPPFGKRRANLVSPF